MYTFRRPKISYKQKVKYTENKLRRIYCSITFISKIHTPVQNSAAEVMKKTIQE